MYSGFVKQVVLGFAFVSKYENVKVADLVGDVHVLAHHGIKGQKWGVRNGPPYPLGASDHFEREKNARWKKSLTKPPSEKYNRHRVAGSSHTGKVGRSYNEIDKQMVRSINGDDTAKQTLERQTNCTHCATSYILNSVFGKSTTAKPYYGVDEISGIVNPNGRSVDIYDALFDGVKRKAVDSDEYIIYMPWKTNSIKSVMSSADSGSTGVIFAANRFTGGGHVMCYEKDIKGEWSIIDPQLGKVFNSDDFSPASYLGKWQPLELFDFSEAKVKDEVSLYRYLVNKNDD